MGGEALRRGGACHLRALFQAARQPRKAIGECVRRILRPAAAPANDERD